MQSIGYFLSGAVNTVKSFVGLAGPSGDSVEEEPELQVKELTDEEMGKLRMDTAIERTRNIIRNLQAKHKIPGVSIAVTINGKHVWSEGFGYADLENKVPCSPDSVMKIASISKCITSALMAKEVDEGRLDLMAHIDKYIKWPKLYFQNQRVFITPKMLACHMSGIRGYTYMPELTSEEPDFRYKEFHITEKCPNVTSALESFKKDELMYEPGKRYNYSNHGYTLLSAILEKTSKMNFKDMLSELFSSLGMSNTHVDDQENIIYNLARHYKVVDGDVVNCPHSESTFKIAGAGLLSTPIDLMKFANYLISCHHSSDVKPSPKKGRLSRKTVRLLWSPIQKTILINNLNFQYGLGWQINHTKENGRMYVGHGGRTTGASCVMMISLPFYKKSFKFYDADVNFRRPDDIPEPKAKSIAMALLTNMQGISLNDLSIDILDLFHRAFDKEVNIETSRKTSSYFCKY